MRQGLVDDNGFVIGMMCVVDRCALCWDLCSEPVKQNCSER